MAQNMLIIDPDLYNPKVNGVDLIVGGRINPAIGLAKEDLAEGDNITIEQMADGRLKISANVPDSGVSYTIFSEAQMFDFFKNLPPQTFCYISTILSGINLDPEYMTIYYVPRVQYLDQSPAEGYTYDISGNITYTPPDTSLGTIVVNATLRDIEYISGQGMSFEIDTEVESVYYILMISSDSEFNSVLVNQTGTAKEFFISFNSFSPGTYYWKLKIIDISTLSHSLWTSNSFYFEHEELPYYEYAMPSGLTQDSTDWVITGTNFSGTYWQLFSTAGNEGYFFPEGYVAWKRVDSQALLITGDITLTYPNYYFDDGWMSTYADFWIEGSDNGTNWTTIYTGRMSSGTSGASETYAVVNSTPYINLRLRVKGVFEELGFETYDDSGYLTKIEVS